MASGEDGGTLDFKRKDPVDVALYLKAEGISAEICSDFEDNEIDGEAFLDLSESDIKSMVSKLGIVKKLSRLQTKVCQASLATPLSTSNADPLSPTLTQNTTNSLRSSSEREVISPFSPRSRTFSPTGFSDSEDTASVASSVSTLSKRQFSIPDSWPPSIMDCIQQATEEEQRRALTPLVRNEIVRTIATHMFCYDPKPQKDFCTLVAKKLVSKYPFMKDTGERVSGYGSWEKKLIEKVHNLKARTKRHSEGEDTPKAKRGRPKVSQMLTRYPPVKDLGEDDIAVERTVQQLNKELQKDKPRKEIVLSLARNTYHARRTVILSENDDVSARGLILQFKELTKPYVLEQEIDLILEKRDVSKTAMRDWTTKWVPAILEYSRSSTGKLAAAVLQAGKDYEGDNMKDEKMALVVLCKALSRKGNDNAILYIYQQCKMTDDPKEVALSDPVRSAPRVACFPGGGEESQYFVFIESEVLCVDTSFSHALILWFISHYVFNLEYCAKVKELALFFQEFVFKLPATSGVKRQKTATYLTVTTDLQSYLSA